MTSTKTSSTWVVCAPVGVEEEEVKEETVWGCLVSVGVKGLANLGHTLSPNGIKPRIKR